MPSFDLFLRSDGEKGEGPPPDADLRLRSDEDKTPKVTVAVPAGEESIRGLAPAILGITAPASLWQSVGPAPTRNIELVWLLDLPYYDPATETVSTLYIGTRNWRVPSRDSVAPNRQYIGLLTQPLDIVEALFEGSRLGGATRSDHGESIILNPDGTYSLTPHFTAGRAVQGQIATLRVGNPAVDLSEWLVRRLRAQDWFESSDGTEVVVAWKHDADADLQLRGRPKYRGLGQAVAIPSGTGSANRLESDASTPALTSALVARVWYRLTADPVAATELIGREESGSTNAQFAVRATTTPELEFLVRDDVGVDHVLTAADLDPLADGEMHCVDALWDGSTLHLWRDGEKSATTTAFSGTPAGHGAKPLTIGAAGDAWRVAEAALLFDATLSEATIEARAHRALQEEEWADYTRVWALNEGTGATAFDELDGDDLTLGGSCAWTTSGEGEPEQAEQEKPGGFGRALALAETIDRKLQVAAVHWSHCRGIGPLWAGAVRLSQRFTIVSDQVVLFGDGTIHLNDLSVWDFGGAQQGQKCTIAGSVADDGLYTLDDPGDVADPLATIKVTAALTGQSAGASTVTVTIDKHTDGTSDPDVEIESEVVAGVRRSFGRLRYLSVIPEKPVHVEVRGSLAAETYVERAADVWQRILEVHGIAGAAIASADVTALNAQNAAACGVWMALGERRSARELLDVVARTVGASWRRSSLADQYRIRRLEPATGAMLALSTQNLFSLERAQSVPVVSRETLRYRRNPRPLTPEEVSGAALADDVALLEVDWQVVTSAPDAAALAAYPDAEEAPVLDTAFWEASAAQAEADRVYAMFKSPTEIFVAQTPFEPLGFDVSDPARVTHPDFGSTAAGKLCAQVKLECKASDDGLGLVLWG